MRDKKRPTLYVQNQPLLKNFKLHVREENIFSLNRLWNFGREMAMYGVGVDRDRTHDPWHDCPEINL
jgi:hypothetical protein